MRSNRVAFRMLTNCSLFQSIVGFSSSVSYFVFQVKETLNAICSGDKRTLEAIKLLCEVKGLSVKLWQSLVGLMAFAVTHTKDLELLKWLMMMMMRCIEERLDGQQYPSQALPPGGDVALDKYHHRGIRGDQKEALGEQGDVGIAKWAMRHEYRISTHGAAKFGHLDLLRYLHEVGYPDFSPNTMDEAAANGYLDIIKFLHENRQEAYTDKVMDGAAKNGHLEVLKFLHENQIEGCIGTAINLAAEDGRTKCVKFLFEVNSDRFVPREDLVNTAASNGHLELIKYFHTNEYFRFSPKTMHNAAIANHLHIVKFLHENRTEGCKVDTLFECDTRELHRVVEYLFSHRPMKNPAQAIVRAKREDRPLLAAKLERAAAATNASYLYR